MRRPRALNASMSSSSTGIVPSRSRQTERYSFDHETTTISASDTRRLSERLLLFLTNETVIDGEIVAFDDSGRPSFNTLQNYGFSNVAIFYFVFHLLILAAETYALRHSIPDESC
jgi:ATP-dependent DNA ligase